jgi:NHL repeat
MRGWRGQLKRARVSSVLVLSALLFASAPAGAADISFCPFGTGPGQCDEPSGVAVDTSNGRVYVADTGNSRINVFDEDGNFIDSFGTPGTAPGQLTRPKNLAVDDDPTSPAFHDVYVVDNPPGLGITSKPRVQRFSPSGAFVLSLGEGVVHSGGNPVAVGPGGTVYVGDDNVKNGPEALRLIKRFTPAGVLLGSSSLPEATIISYLTVDSSGHAYVGSQNSTQSITKWELKEPSATLLNSFDLAANTTALAVDSEDNLVAAQWEGPHRIITKRDQSGNVLKRFAYEQIQTNLQGLAVGVGGDLFGSESDSKAIRISQPLPGPIACCLATIPRNTSATLKGQVNPEGKATTYQFDYVTEADYLINGFTGAASTPESASVGSDFALHNAEAQIGCVKVEVPTQPSCLEPSTTYRYRLVTTNADGNSETEGSFTTQPPIEIEEVFATDVGIDAGRLHAVVNPLGIPATGYFEYVDNAAYEADLAEGVGHDGFATATKVPDIDAGKEPINFGEGETGKELARELTSLAADTVYHYRFTAANPFLTVKSDEKVLTTFPVPALPARVCPNEEFRTAASAALPECRAYEMVSPVDKNGNDIKVLVSQESFPTHLDQSSADGNRFTYSSSTAFGDAVSAPWSSQYLATRRAGEGWSTHSLNPPRDSVGLVTHPTMIFNNPYKLFDSELDNGWFFHDAEPTLDECAPPGFANFYRRSLKTGEYEALLPAEPTNIEAAENNYRPEIQGASTDGTRTVIRVNTKLTEDAAKINGYQIYEHVAGEGCGELRLVSYLPNGQASAVSASVGAGGQPGEGREGTIVRAVSGDGSRVFFMVDSIATSFAGRLYVRVNADQPQSPVSKGKCTDLSLGCTLEISSPASQFWTAATDGSRAIHSITDAASSRLYEFDVDKALAGEPASTLIAEGLAGNSSFARVAAANEDLSRLYFVTNKALGGEGVEGGRNLFLREGGAIRLVATLRSGAGEDRYSGLGVGSPSLINNGVRATTDGGHLAFASASSPIGYDNINATDGRPVFQVYLYDAETDDLRCVSCNPTGARPRARAIGDSGALVSAYMAPGESAMFAPRALSSDGNRLFFESFEALLPRDTNGKGDVYEWQRASGEAECEEIAAELYVPNADGCLSLISSGQSPVDSEFADASPDGHDVFIRTQSSLLPQDDGLVDIYDARINGGFAQPPLPPAACEGEACQGPLNAPDDPTPASSAFEGAGNEPLASCRKGKVRRKGRCVAKQKSRKVQKAQKKQKAQKAQKKQKRKAR